MRRALPLCLLSGLLSGLLPACSKGHLPTPPPSSLSFYADGVLVHSGSLLVDTTASVAGPYRPNICALSRVLLPGMRDSCGFELFLFGYPGTYASFMSGSYYDTSTLYTLRLAFVPLTTGGFSAVNDFTVRRSLAHIGFNNRLYVTGVFEGAVAVTSGVYPGGDSLIINNGSFAFVF
ncbi:MAG TPA: hypothetical protein VL547_23655 [Dinghuibacter sp.]|uniref:hypothetical protein n=1 Tax=Dinghuibacter sp. TaxID=2024697 RepID=UPI002BF70AB8|nr:hypothetical protein [Dinghuibacter sp.]HTJ15061.1 hypothetical protein [Dinghuibacter sp.]